VTFRFAWQAPTAPGGVDIGVAALAGNGNNAPSGDSPGTGEFQWVFGCEGRSVYRDLDLDGYGSKTAGSLLACASAPPPTGYATLDGDCDENNEKVHPGAAEICNRQDDDCNGLVDENAPQVVMWPDGDGDGYYKFQTGTSKTGCGNVPGYAASGGDCDDADPAVHPGAAETCNYKDDNCDGEVDERVRPQCGIGWCSRYGPTCNAADCRPGPPRAETCNRFDDDCDGEDDNGACQAGMVCSGTECVPSQSSGASGAPSSGAGASSSGAGASSSGAGASSSGAGASPSGAGASSSGAASGGAANRDNAGGAPPSGCSVDTVRGSQAGWASLALAACLGFTLRRSRTRRSRA